MNFSLLPKITLVCICLILSSHTLYSQHGETSDIEVSLDHPENLVQKSDKGIINLAVVIKNTTDHEVSFIDDTGIYHGVYLYTVNAEGVRSAVFPFDPSTFAKRPVGHHIIYRAIAPSQTYLVKLPVMSDVLNKVVGKSLRLGVTEITPGSKTIAEMYSTREIFSNPFGVPSIK